MSRDRRRRIIAWVLAVAGAFALGAFLSWLLASSLSLSGSGSGEGQLQQPSGSFTITGDLVEPGSPGILEPLDLTVTNPFDDPLQVTRLTVEVTAVDAPKATDELPCSTDDFVVEQLANGVTLRLRAGEARSFSQLGIAEEDWPQVGMTNSDTNQDGCKGASLSLTYTATGRADQ